MVFTCGEEIENVTGFFVKHFVSNEDYIKLLQFYLVRCSSCLVLSVPIFH